MACAGLGGFAGRDREGEKADRQRRKGQQRRKTRITPLSQCSLLGMSSCSSRFMARLYQSCTKRRNVGGP